MFILPFNYTAIKKQSPVMACGEDNRFSAIYSSIEGDEYEEYVEITNGPTAYLVPNKVPPRGELKASMNKSCNNYSGNPSS